MKKITIMTMVNVNDSDPVFLLHTCTLKRVVPKKSHIVQLFFNLAVDCLTISSGL